MATDAPLDASARAVANPIPREPPVTNATLPESEAIKFSRLLHSSLVLILPATSFPSASAGFSPQAYADGIKTSEPQSRILHVLVSTVCIIGAGELGGATAHALARHECVSRVILIDVSAGVAAGKALDILQAGAVDGSHTHLEGSADLSRVVGAAVCVIADRSGRTSNEWQGDEGLGLLNRVAPYTGDAPLVFAGPSQADLLLAAAREAHLRRERLIGSAPEALLGAVKSMAALEAQCSPAEIGLTVLGAPPRGFVVPWSEASIGGHALERVLTQVQLSRIEARLPHLWPPGPHALGLAAARVAEALVTSSRRTYSIFTILGGEFGARGRVGVLPALLSSRGIVATRVPALNTRERVQVENALG
jgi:malate dehydrogenase